MRTRRSLVLVAASLVIVAASACSDVGTEPTLRASPDAQRSTISKDSVEMDTQNLGSGPAPLASPGGGGAPADTTGRGPGGAGSGG